MGAVAYQLEMPPSSQVHPVVHISQLKIQIPPNTQVHTSLNIFSDEPDEPVLPMQVLDTAIVPRGATSTQKIKVQWSGMTPPLVTWEDQAALRRRYPAWGQATL